MKIVLNNGVEIDNISRMTESYSKDKTFLNITIEGDAPIESLVNGEGDFSKITVVRKGMEDVSIEGYESPGINRSFEEHGNTTLISLTKDA